MPSRLFFIACSAGAAIALAGVARAQNALGDGRILDRNLQRGSGGFNPAGTDWRREANYRNAIVTGNVGGGRSFRGNIGYSAPSDFRGVTGSDQFFDFQRDALTSGLAANNLRGTNALRLAFDQTTFGQTEGIGGQLIIDRATSGVTGADIASGGGAPGGSGADRFGMIRGALRSTANFQAQMATTPSVIGQASSNANAAPGSEMQFLTSSNLQGIKVLKQSNAAFGADDRSFSFSGLQQKKAEDEAEAKKKPRTPHESLMESLRVQADPVAKQLSEQQRVETSPLSFGEPTKTDFLKPTGEPDPAKPDAPPKGDTEKNEPYKSGFDRELEALRARLSGQTDDALMKSFRERMKTAEEDKAPSVLDAPQRPSRGGGDGEPGEKPAPPESVLPTPPGVPAQIDDEDPEAMTKRVLEALKNEFVRVQGLKPLEPDRSVYTRHMTAGEELLGAGEYFNAEERFTAALNAQPGDAMAAVGRIHAQIGAGMYRSAATNLRNLLSAYPEFIAARFDAALLPGTERLDRIRTQLRARMQYTSMIGREASLLLAYAGVQTDDPALVREGLARLREIDAEMGTAADPLEEVLRETWLKE